MHPVHHQSLRSRYSSTIPPRSTWLDESVPDELDPNGRIALVTGANKGIGYATAAGLAKLGMTVLLGARDEERGRSAAAALQSEGLDVSPLLIDVGDDGSVARAAAEIDERHGKLD